MVLGGRKTTTKRMSKRKGFPVKRKVGVRLPTRLKGSRVNYAINRAVSKAVNGMSENKIVPLTNRDENAPTAIQTGAIVYTKSFTIGTIPAIWIGTTGLTALNGMEFPLGTHHSQRIGRYIYLQKTHLTVELDMYNQAEDMVPIEFRMIVCKARRSNNPQGLSNKFSETLFLAPNGNAFGHATSGINGTDLMVQPLNRRDWDVRQDKKFLLSNPLFAASTSAVYSGKYPIMKRFVYNLPYYSKCEINTVTNAPTDLDTNYVIVMYARSLGKDFPADNWEVNTRGSTTFKDN